MTMPHSLGSGMPGNPGNVPVYPGNVAGNPYTDMQPAPQVAAGVVSVLASADDSVEWTLAPISFILVVAMFYILGGIMNIIGLVLGKTGRKRAQDPRQAKACMVGIWLNAAPMLVFLVAEILAVLWMMGTSL